MSQFQLPDGTRLWAEGYDNEKIAIHLRNEIELEQWGVGRSSKPYLLYQLQRLLHSNTNNLFNSSTMRMSQRCKRRSPAGGWPRPAEKS